MKNIINQFKALLFAFSLSLKHSKTRTVKYMVSSIISNIAAFCFDVYFLAYIMGLLIDGAGWNTVLLACLSGAVLVIIRIASSEYATLMQIGFTRINMEKINRSLYEKSLEHDLSEYNNSKYYDDYLFVIQNGASSVNRSVDITIQIITACFYLVIFVFEMFRHSMLIIALIIAMIAFYTQFNYFTYKKIAAIDYENNVALQPFIRRKDYFDRLFYLKSYAYDLKNDRLYNRLDKEYDHSVKEYENKVMEGNKKLVLWNCLNSTNFNMFFALAAPLLLVAALRFEGITSVAIYWQVAALFNKLANLYIFKAHGDIMSLSKYVKKFKEFVEEKTDTSACSSEDMASTGISVKNLSFSYDTNGDFSLKNINMDIAQGERIAIVGRNGSGKTTLMNLLLGLYTPTAGKILINGEDITHGNKAFTKSTLGLMSQNFNLYYCSIKDNIKMGDDSYTDAEVMKAAELAQCGEFLSEFEKGIETTYGKEIDQTAVELSGGQAQRIAMARMFLTKAPVIFMDEPTAAIDPILEKAITDNLMQKTNEKTTIIITHRLDITRFVDRIYVMENGTIVETGTFDEFMGKKTVFSDMYRAQKEVENNYAE